MYIVGSIRMDVTKRGPQITQLHLFYDFDDALEFATELAMEQQDDESRGFVRKELRKDGDYVSLSEEFSVFIRQPEDYKPGQPQNSDL